MIAIRFYTLPQLHMHGVRQSWQLHPADSSGIRSRRYSASRVCFSTFSASLACIAASSLASGTATPASNTPQGSQPAFAKLKAERLHRSTWLETHSQSSNHLSSL
ncbi:hypothetical protein ABBQ38_014144 [Trebouxia sp. C0009 RCD-2024]